MKTVIMHRGKRRTSIPAAVWSKLSVPFDADERVPIMRHYDLVMVQVRRQHLLDVAMSKGKRPLSDMYKDPQVEDARPSSKPARASSQSAEQDKEKITKSKSTTKTKTKTNAKTRDKKKTSKTAGRSPDASSDDDDLFSVLSLSSEDEDEDAHEVQGQNRSFPKRGRVPSDSSTTDDDGSSVKPPRRRSRRETFNPSETQLKIHKEIASDNFQGTSPQSKLENLAEYRKVDINKAPPVYRGIFHFDFDHLDPMHFEPRSIKDRIEARTGPGADYSERNPLKEAPKAKNRALLMRSLRTLRTLAEYCYRPEVVEIIDCAISFLDSYNGVDDDDSTAWDHLSLWVGRKFANFRAAILVSGLSSALQTTRLEFSRNDELFMEVRDLARRDRRPSMSAPSRNRGGSSSGERQPASNPIPRAVLDALPADSSGRRLCMRFVSNVPCRGGRNGGCYASNRAHFHPLSIPDIVINCINERFKGLKNPQEPKTTAKDSSAARRSELTSRARHLLAGVHAEATDSHVQVFASKFGLVPPERSTKASALDTGYIAFHSELARRARLTLPDFVRLMRGEVLDDSRPNKDLFELKESLGSDMVATVRRWNKVVRTGVEPRWNKNKPARQLVRPVNHRSTLVHLDNIRQHIRKGQRDGRYLIVDESLLDVWTEVFISPIGVVDKRTPNGADIRIINDYSFPEGEAVNDFTDKSDFPLIEYDPPAHIAFRIHELKTRFPDEEVLVMLGDVAGAFRHVPVHTDAVHMFAFCFDGFLVIDLACGFGWCGSPAAYALAGSIINRLYETSTPVGHAPLDDSPFAGNVWCDDHTCVEVNTGTRCHDADFALRMAMLTVLGPTAVNEQKFTAWSTESKALGLLWDTRDGSVSMPTEKIQKARERVHGVLSAGQVSRSQMNKLLGMLRHVASCFPPARAFYQRIQAMTDRMDRIRPRRPSSEVINDLLWFKAILTNEARPNGIPVSQFARLTVPDVHVFMDASDSGLCVLEPNRHEFIRLKFSDEMRSRIVRGEEDTSINVRELHSAVLAALLWGPAWQATHASRPVQVRLHIDNSSAVSWSNKRSSRQPKAQLYNRLMAVAEFQYQLVISAEHIPGTKNVMADAGSRAWDNSHTLWRSWTDLSCGWTRVHVVAPYDDLSAVWESCSQATPWQALPRSSMMMKVRYIVLHVNERRYPLP